MSNRDSGFITGRNKNEVNYFDCDILWDDNRVKVEAFISINPRHLFVLNTTFISRLDKDSQKQFTTFCLKWLCALVV